MFRLPVFGILLTAVLLSLPGPAGASFAVTEYAPVLSRLYKDKQSPLASSYRISFDKSKSSAPCLTAYTLTGTAAELIRYDCTRLPADNIFSRSRSENDGSLKELAAVFNGLRHNNDDKPGIALVNDGTIDKIYADFINNASGTAFGQGAPAAEKRGAHPQHPGCAGHLLYDPQQRRMCVPRRGRALF